MFNKLKKFLKSKRAVGSVATAIKVGTACVLGAAVLVGGVALTNDVVLPNTNNKIQDVGDYTGDEEDIFAPGGVTPVSVPVVDPLNPSGTIPEGCRYIKATEFCECGLINNAMLTSSISQEGLCAQCGPYFFSERVILTDGDSFPAVPVNGERFETAEYVYTYCRDRDLGGSDDAVVGWEVSSVVDNTKSSYGTILESINGISVNAMSNTFSYCANMVVAPNIPDTIISMDGTFCNCSSLTTVNIPNNVTRLYGVFTGCTSLTTAPTIPDGAKYGLMGTFVGCTSLTSVTLPAGCGLAETFKNCTQLVEITYLGTMSQWNEWIAWAYEWNNGSGISIIHCSDGDINL